MRSRFRRWVMFGAMAVAAAGLLTACGSGEVSLSLQPGSVSDCYRGLPTAKAAIHEDSATLQGVHRVTLNRVLHFLPGVTVPGTSLPVKGTEVEVCTFAFEGHFMPRQVTGAPPQAQGPVAIVVVDSKDLRLVASYVGQGLPHRFSRRVASPQLVVDSPHSMAARPPVSTHRTSGGAKAA
ncbi:MAG: hypothetical protein FWC87_05495 [Acidimicrobiaceae bacterium]|nr:hypothetical protein [Acidimicrobiaceae bacterium]